MNSDEKRSPNVLENPSSINRIPENIRRMFLVKIHIHCPGDPD